MAQSRNRITIVDIARALGVSHTTVSYALRGDPRISPETTQRVVQKASELNYKPNIIARALVQRGSSLIGVLLPHTHGSFFAAIINGIQEEVEKRGYNIILCDSEYSEEREEKHIHSLIDKQVEGILINPVSMCPTNLPPYHEIISLKIPLILVGRMKEDVPAPYARVDNHLGGYLVANHLLALGHRDIVYVSEFKNELFNRESRRHSENLERHAGCLQRVREQGLENHLQVVEALWENVTENTVDEILALKPRPTAIFAYSDMIAIELMRILRLRGFSLPEDFSIVGYDDLEIASLVKPALTTISQVKKELGTISALKLLGLIEGRRTAETIFKPQLIIRNSTGPGPFAGT